MSGPEKPLYDQRTEISGSASTSYDREDGHVIWIYGPTAYIDGVSYMLPAGACEYVGGVRVDTPLPQGFEGCPYNLDKRELVADPAARDHIASVIRGQLERDAEREAAREARAKELAKGDTLLEEVLLWNMWYRDGDADPDPWIVEGIAFYQVGRNSSHQFFVGVRDGQRYTCSYGEGDEAPHVEAVETWDGGYYGHC